MQKGKWVVAAGLLVSGLAAAYTGAAWYIGGQVESGLTGAYAELNRYGPYVTVSKPRYERGVFSAKESAKISLYIPDPLRPPRELASFIVVSRIRHLPLSGLFALRAASIDSTLNFVPGSLPEETLWTNGEDLARVHTSIALHGAVRTTITIPAFDAPRLSSKPASLTLDFPDGLNRYSMKGSAPGFAITGDHGERLQVSDARLQGKHRRMLAGVPDIYAGTDRLTISAIEAAGPGGKPLAEVHGAAIEMAATPVTNGEFMDTAIKYSLDKATILGNSFGPAGLEVAVRHLHTRSFASLSRLDGRVQGSSEKQKEKDADDLLLNNPEITGKLSFTVPAGDTLVSARAGLHDVTAADLKGNSASLRNKVALAIDARCPAVLLMDAHGQALPIYQPLAQALNLPADAGALRRMIEQGYIIRDGNDLKTRLLFQDGRYSLNGKEYTFAERRHGRHSAGG